MAALIIRLPDGKRERLKDLARARKQSVTKLFDEMATVLIAEYDAETRFRARAARGASIACSPSARSKIASGAPVSSRPCSSTGTRNRCAEGGSLVPFSSPSGASHPGIPD